MQIEPEVLRQKLHLLDNTSEVATGDQASVNEKIELLKEVALTLLDEVESLRGARSENTGRMINLQDEVRRFEMSLIRRALEATGGHQTRAAQMLGINLTTLHYKIKRYKIQVRASGSYLSELEATA